MFGKGYWKYGLALGAGIALGAVGVVLLARGGFNLKKSYAALLGHALDVKDKAGKLIDTAKENLEDLTAEAKREQELRRNAEHKS
jgi:hypothetical protein